MIIATTPRTAEQRIDYSRIPALQLPEGQNPERAQEYYNAQLLDNSTPFYRSCLSMAQMSMNNQIVRIVAPTQHIANAIALCVASVVKLIEQSTAVKTPVPASAMATVAMEQATYRVGTPASSDVAVPDLSTAPRYAAQQPFEGQGVSLGSGYFAEQLEDGYNLWFGTGALAPMAKVPDIETARQVVAGTRGKAHGKMVEGHFQPDDAFKIAMAATIHSLTLQAC
ncbi:MAG: hypothetical protein U0X20_11720 [Caldilineaceae bacterium]